MLTAPIVRRAQIRGVLQVLNKHEGAFTDARRGVRARARRADRPRARLHHAARRRRAARAPPARSVQPRRSACSPAMAAVYEMIVRAAQTDATVLLHGETGTGKGLLARAIHVNSERRDAAVHPRRLHDAAGGARRERAVRSRARRVHRRRQPRDRQGRGGDGGTLFLDEIGELPLPLQSKLLRFVQEREFERVGGRETLTADVRIVAATNRDLAAMVGAGQFRSDLYFRLRVVEIEIPPLRARGADDIADLAAHFVDAVRAPLPQGPAAARRRREARAARVRLAGQRARAREHDRARRRDVPSSTIGVRTSRSTATPAPAPAVAADPGDPLARRHAGDTPAATSIPVPAG